MPWGFAGSRADEARFGSDAVGASGMGSIGADAWSSRALESTERGAATLAVMGEAA
jgi:hypothetical protein